MEFLCLPLLKFVGTCRMAFQSVSEQHLAALAAQLLLAEGIQDVGSWLPIICCLALEAAQSVSPSAMVANGNIDPRFYIKVQRPTKIPCLKSTPSTVWDAKCACTAA